MLLLPNGCRSSEISVSPKNWLTVKKLEKTADGKIKPWFLFFRFYDPQLAPSGKLFHFRGMNQFSQIQTRRESCILMAEDIKNRLLNEGYNPINNVTTPPLLDNSQVDPSTSFIAALEIALTKVIAVRGTLIDMGSVVRGVKQSASQLGIDKMPISKITRKYIKQILEHRSQNNMKYDPETKKKKLYWSANRHNKYRTYLMRLFQELLEMEAIEVNPVRDISKMKQTFNRRDTLTPDQITKINNFLFSNYHDFWTFVQIFCNSGGRITELLSVKVKDVDIIKQEFKCTVKKGKSVMIKDKVIKNVVLPLWINLLKDADPEDYIISEGLRPGHRFIRPEQLTRRWRMHVKQKLGINADLYSLKHLNTTETAEFLNNEYNYDPSTDVAQMNGHTSTAMIVKIYDTKNVQRQNDRLKKVPNVFR